MTFRAHHVWAAAEKDVQGRIERSKCWKLIMADPELQYILGRSDVFKGKAILGAMKAARALDVSGDDKIDEHEFQRLFNPCVWPFSKHLLLLTYFYFLFYSLF